MQVMDPVGVGNPAVPAVDDGVGSRPRASAARRACPVRDSKGLPSTWRLNGRHTAVHRHGRQRREVGPGAMRDEMDLVARRQIAGEGVVRRVHPAEGREVARDDQPDIIY